MKKIILMNAFLLFAFLGFGQAMKNLSINIGPENKYDKNIAMNYYSMHLEQLNDQTTVIVEPFGKSLSITRLDKNGKIMEETKVQEFPKNLKSANYIILEADKRLIVFEEKNKKITKLSAQILDLVSGKFISEIRPILEYEDAGEFGAVVSSDAGNILVMYQTQVEGNAKEHYSAFAVFDKNFNKLYTIENKDFVSGKIGIQRYSLIGKKLVVMMGFMNENEDNLLLKKSVKNMNIKVYIYSESGSLEKELQVENNKNVFVDFFDVEKTKDNSLKFVTAYSDSEKGIVKGFASFYVDLNSTNAPVLQLNEIGEKLMCQYTMFRGEADDIKLSYESDKNKTKYEFKFDQIIAHDDGYFAIISQKGAQGIGSKTIYWLRDFIIASYDTKNNLKWIKKIPVVFEQQIVSNIGMQWLVKDGELILIHPSGGIEIDENIESNWTGNKSDNQWIKINRLYMMFEKLTKEGKLIRENFYDLNNSKLSTYSLAVESKSNSIPLLFYKMKEYQIYRFDIK